jgi:hypothetical protein
MYALHHLLPYPLQSTVIDTRPTLPCTPHFQPPPIQYPSCPHFYQSIPLNFPYNIATTLMDPSTPPKKYVAEYG